jgi:hypothetical protein
MLVQQYKYSRTNAPTPDNAAFSFSAPPVDTVFGGLRGEALQVCIDKKKKKEKMRRGGGKCNTDVRGGVLQMPEARRGGCTRI